MARLRVSDRMSEAREPMTEPSAIGPASLPRPGAPAPSPSGTRDSPQLGPRTSDSCRHGRRSFECRSHGPWPRSEDRPASRVTPRIFLSHVSHDADRAPPGSNETQTRVRGDGEGGFLPRCRSEPHGRPVTLPSEARVGGFEPPRSEGTCDLEGRRRTGLSHTRTSSLCLSLRVRYTIPLYNHYRRDVSYGIP